MATPRTGNPVGRPSSFSQEVADKICELMETGLSLKEILEQDAALPSRSAIAKWLWSGEHPEFTQRYEKATEHRAARMFDEIKQIADDGRNDFMVNKLGDKVTYSEAINRSRLRIDTRKWILARMYPHKYGDHVAVSHQVEDSGEHDLTMIARKVAFAFRVMAESGDGMKLIESQKAEEPAE